MKMLNYTDLWSYNVYAAILYFNNPHFIVRSKDHVHYNEVSRRMWSPIWLVEHACKKYWESYKIYKTAGLLLCQLQLRKLQANILSMDNQIPEMHCPDLMYVYSTILW